MAIFFHGARSIVYQLQSMPVAHDVVLLQDSQKSTEVWEPVLHGLKVFQLPAGRVLTCDWFAKTESGQDFQESELARDLLGFLRALGIKSPYVVASGNAIRVVQSLEQQAPGYVGNTLLVTQDLARWFDLENTMRQFLQT